MHVDVDVAAVVVVDVVVVVVDVGFILVSSKRYENPNTGLEFFVLD